MRLVNFYIFFSIELSKFHNMSSGFSGITWVGLALITKVPVTLTWVNFFRFFFFTQFYYFVFNKMRIELYHYPLLEFFFSRLSQSSFIF